MAKGIHIAPTRKRRDRATGLLGQCQALMERKLIEHGRWLRCPNEAVRLRHIGDGDNKLEIAVCGHHSRGMALRYPWQNERQW